MAMRFFSSSRNTIKTLLSYRCTKCTMRSSTLSRTFSPFYTLLLYSAVYFVAVPQENSISATKIEQEDGIFWFLGIVLVADTAILCGRATKRQYGYALDGSLKRVRMIKVTLPAGPVLNRQICMLLYDVESYAPKGGRNRLYSLTYGRFLLYNFS